MGFRAEAVMAQNGSPEQIPDPLCRSICVAGQCSFAACADSEMAFTSADAHICSVIINNILLLLPLYRFSCGPVGGEQLS